MTIGNKMHITQETFPRTVHAGNKFWTLRYIVLIACYFQDIVGTTDDDNIIVTIRVTSTILYID